MIGCVITDRATITLGDDGRFVCAENPTVADGLNAWAATEDWWGPDKGRPGSMLLHAVAKLLGGKVEMPPQVPGPFGRVY